MQRPAPISPLPMEGTLPGSSSPCLWSAGIFKERSINLPRPALPNSSRSAPEIEAQSHTRGSPAHPFPRLGRSDTGADTPGTARQEQSRIHLHRTRPKCPSHGTDSSNRAPASHCWGAGRPKGTTSPYFSSPSNFPEHNWEG